MASRSISAFRYLRRPIIHRLVPRPSPSSAALVFDYHLRQPLQSSSSPLIRSRCGSSSSSTLYTPLRYFSSDAEGVKSKVVEAKDDAHYGEMFKDVTNKGSLGVVYFTAQWCGPCKLIAPVIDELSLEFNDVAFIKIDVDKVAVEETMKNSQIGVVPTFHFYKRGKKIGELTGLVEGKLRQVVEQLRSE